MSDNSDETFEYYLKTLHFMIVDRYSPVSMKHLRAYLFGDLTTKSDGYESKTKLSERIIDFFYQTNLITIVTQKEKTQSEFLIVKKEILEEEKEKIVKRKKQLVKTQKTYYYLEDDEATALSATSLKYRLFKDEDFYTKEDLAEVKKKGKEIQKIGLNIPKVNIDLFCETIVSMLLKRQNTNIFTNERVQAISQSKLFSFNTSFISNTVTKLMLKTIKEVRDEYTVIYLLNFIQLNSSIDCKIVIDNTEFTITNTRLEKIIFNAKSFDLQFHNARVTLTDITQIISIKCSDTNSLEDDMKQLRLMLNDYDVKEIKPFIKIIEDIDMYQEMFMY